MHERSAEYICKQDQGAQKLGSGVVFERKAGWEPPVDYLQWVDWRMREDAEGSGRLAEQNR